MTPTAPPRRPPPAGLAAFVPPTLPPEAAQRYQQRAAALPPGELAPVPDVLPIHPEADSYPMLPLKELQDVAADIRAHGLRHPIVMHKGQVVDGRNRLAACLLGGVDPTFGPWDGRGTIEAFIESVNVHRRHLSPAVLAARAAARVKLYEAEAKARMTAAPHRVSTLPVAGDDSSLATPPLRGRAVEQAARSVPGAGLAATKILHGIGKKEPAIVRLAERDKVTIAQAQALMRLDKGERSKAIQRIQKGEKAAKVLPRPEPLRLSPAVATPAAPPKGQAALFSGEMTSLVSAVARLRAAAEHIDLAIVYVGDNPAVRAQLEGLRGLVQEAAQSLAPDARKGTHP